MNRFIFFFSFIFILCFQACAQEVGYNFSKPTEKIYLPEILHEISGLTIISEHSFACVQDELGKVFFYDLDSSKIVKEIHFGDPGDYEGITKVDADLYILRSDGLLIEIKDYASDGFKIETYDTQIPARDNEGLCFDPQNNRLLIGCKSKLDIEPSNKDLRAIYGFDLNSKTLSENPIYQFNLHTIRAFADSRDIEMPDKVKKSGDRKEGELKFKMSAIAIHPQTQKLYLISAKDHLLFVFDENGNPEYAEMLNQKLFNKAEGITFFKNGDLLITNEGQDYKPTVLRFNKR